MNDTMSRRKNRDLIIGLVITFFLLAGLLTCSVMVMNDSGSMAPMSISNSNWTYGSGNVAIVEIYGAIDEGTGRDAIEQLEHWRQDDDIKAILLHINSPGGGTSISQELYQAVMRAKEEKPVVASFASVAASGGYYIASGADEIIANPSSITGSIGVIFQMPNFKDLMGKVGITLTTIKSGELKDVGNYSRDMTEKEELMLRSVVMDSYEQFVDAVVKGREMTKEEVLNVADGSVFTGLQAYHLGLVDTLGGLYEAVNLAGELGSVSGEPVIARARYRTTTRWFDLLDKVATKVDNAVEKVSNSTSPDLQYILR
jgi:protease-4